MSLDEAAVESRTSVSAIKALLHRAIENLRKHKSHEHG
jgi:RNA polymerase sigma-70 factor (ECF subfamily)